MTDSSTLLRSLVVYGLCLPLAAFLGYMLATPQDRDSLLAIGVTLFVLMIPLFLRWHHAWLIATWNVTAMLFFLPGSPQVWMGLALLSLGISGFQYALNRQRAFVSAPSVSWSLVMLAVVVLATARLAGGFGLRVLGSDVQGGRRYFQILISIVGFFALTGKRIPLERAGLYVGLYFLGYATLLMGSLISSLGSGFTFLYLIFPVESIGVAANDPMVGEHVARSSGLHALGWGAMCMMLARYGLQGIGDLRRPLRFLFFASFLVVAAYGGFRSLVVQFAILMGGLFLLEGLYRTRALPATIMLLILGGGLLVGFASQLPRPIQRALAVIPGLDIDPIARIDAQASTEWRLGMWRDVLPQVPRYLLLGKGYGFDPRTADIAAMRSVMQMSSEGSEVTSDFHNGPLSVIIPFGIFGALAFLWFLGASLRVLYLNYQNGDPALARINTLLLACFVVKTIMFFVVFGSLYAELAEFGGLIGLSVSLNGGIARAPVPVTEPTPPINRFRLSPGLRRPLEV